MHVYSNSSCFKPNKKYFFPRITLWVPEVHTFIIIRYPKNILGLKIKSVDNHFKDSYSNFIKNILYMTSIIEFYKK